PAQAGSSARSARRKSCSLHCTADQLLNGDVSMWFSFTRKVRRNPITRKPRGGFRPRLEALEDRRLMSAGAMDTSFGGSGLVSTPLSAVGTFNGSDHPSVAVQADGKIVTGAYVAGAGGYKNFALARYNSDG